MGEPLKMAEERPLFSPVLRKDHGRLVEEERLVPEAMAHVLLGGNSKFSPGGWGGGATAGLLSWSFQLEP